jgi:hypothetical protein
MLLATLPTGLQHIVDDNAFVIDMCQLLGTS